MSDSGRGSQTHQDLPELLLSLCLLFEQLLEQGAQDPALLRDHLLQHKTMPSAGKLVVPRPKKSQQRGGRIPLTQFSAGSRGPQWVRLHSRLCP